MAYDPIPKPGPGEFPVRPNLEDYDRMRRTWSWSQAAEGITGLKDGGVNIAWECLDRHIQAGKGERTAMIWLGRDGSEERYTFAEMKDRANRASEILVSLGVEKGDRVFVFLERIPELYFTVFGTLQAGAVIGPLFSAFGPDAIRDRLEDSAARVLVTSPALLPRLASIRADLHALEKILVVDRESSGWAPGPDRECSWSEAMKETTGDFEPVPTGAEDYAVMHYTSGTTGKPKGAAHVHQAIQGHWATARYVLDLHEEDIYWCTADPGWVTGTSYGMFGPWSNGVTNLIYQGGFGAEAWYRVIQEHQVSVWYTAPTAVRMLMKAGEALPRRFDLSSLRYICSVGEPLNPEAIVWALKAYGMPIHDNWWQTETGCIQIANYPVLPIRPGSMGKPFPGVTAAIVDETGSELPAGEEGDLVLKPRWPSMFRTYWNRKDLYDSRFRNGWYHTGDRARMDADGYFWFVGRSDDVINTAGHLVGPFEVESALVEHPAVAEAGVIGKPDEERMEIVKAFVSLKDGYEPTDALKEEIRLFVRERLAAHAYPREIEFMASLPKTRSGKIMRRLLKARELGLPEGDTSTLED
ncbi:MAG TPA: acetate--CoA ligase [Candidatus Saccharimonadales bacterium]|nr:acetate--CoA ligase [Candidatus Saccharimonadales bacterium]